MIVNCHFVCCKQRNVYSLCLHVSSMMMSTAPLVHLATLVVATTSCILVQRRGPMITTTSFPHAARTTSGQCLTKNLLHALKVCSRISLCQPIVFCMAAVCLF